MRKTANTRSKSSNKSNNSFQPLLPHESSIQFLNFVESSSQKKTDNVENSPLGKPSNPSQNIGIFIRIRPFLKSEPTCHKLDPCLRVLSNQTIQIYSPEHQNTHKFEFHEIFDENCSQKELFHRTCVPVIETIIQGFNASIFVYGQTGTGKTHTMGLLRKINDKSEGLVPSSLRYLFHQFENNAQRGNWEISMSFYQIYLDEIQDLLNPREGRNLAVRDGNNEPYIEDLTIVTLENLWQAFELINAGLNSRSMQATKLNETSSRSHVILTVHLIQKNPYTGEMILSKANFIDLAGSERASKGVSNLGGNGIGSNKRFEETKFINSSLSSLGTVIASLNDRGRVSNTHVAYRNCKLTRVLQSSLNGESRVYLIATISPTLESVNETISTCVFANRCKNLKIKPSVQTVGTGDLGEDVERIVEYYEKAIESQRAQMRMLENELKALRSCQNNENVNHGIEEINQYLSKLILSLRTFLLGQFKEIHALRVSETEEIEQKYPGIDKGILSSGLIDHNGIPDIDDLENFMGFIQSISKEIVDSIQELSNGNKNFEKLKIEVCQDKVKEKARKEPSAIPQNNEHFYRIIAFLLKNLCFEQKGPISFEKETEGREKLRRFQGNLEFFLQQTLGRENPQSSEFFKRVDACMKLADPLNRESLMESSDPLMKTLSHLRKYSNNSFHDRGLKNNNGGALDHEITDQGDKTQTEVASVSVVNSKAFSNNMNSQNFVNSINLKNLEASIAKSQAAKPPLEKPATNQNPQADQEKIPSKVSSNTQGKNNGLIPKPKSPLINDTASVNKSSNLPSDIPFSKPFTLQDPTLQVDSQDSRRSVEESLGSRRSLKELTIAKKQQRLQLEKADREAKEYSKTTKSISEFGEQRNQTVPNKSELESKAKSLITFHTLGGELGKGVSSRESRESVSSDEELGTLEREEEEEEKYHGKGMSATGKLGNQEKEPSREKSIFSKGKDEKMTENTSNFKGKDVNAGENPSNFVKKSLREEKFEGKAGVEGSFSHLLDDLKTSDKLGKASLKSEGKPIAGSTLVQSMTIREKDAKDEEKKPIASSTFAHSMVGKEKGAKEPSVLKDSKEPSVLKDSKEPGVFKDSSDKEPSLIKPSVSFHMTQNKGLFPRSSDFEPLRPTPDDSDRPKKALNKGSVNIDQPKILISEPKPERESGFRSTIDAKKPNSRNPSIMKSRPSEDSKTDEYYLNFLNENILI